jgi:hypothetical protein
MASEKLNSAIAAIKLGDKATGSRLLNELLKEEPTNETAWIWMTACFDDVGMKIYCLKKVLAINPNNQIVVNALSKLEQPPQPTLEEIVPQYTREIPSSSSEKPNRKEEKSETGLIQDSKKSLQGVDTSQPPSVMLKKPKGKKVILYAIVGVMALSLLCCISVAIYNATPQGKASSTEMAQKKTLAALTQTTTMTTYKESTGSPEPTSTNEPTGTPEPTATKDPNSLDSSEVGTFISLAQIYVKRSLKAPSTAEFPSLFWNLDEYRMGKNNNVVTVQSWVDAENSFGAKIRSNFTAQFDYNSQELLYLEIDGTVVYGSIQQP